MDVKELEEYVQSVSFGDNAEEFLKRVREIVYGSEGYDSPFCLDDCELTRNYIRVHVSNRLLNTRVFLFSRKQKRPVLEQVA